MAISALGQSYRSQPEDDRSAPERGLGTLRAGANGRREIAKKLFCELFLGTAPVGPGTASRGMNAWNQMRDAAGAPPDTARARWLKSR